MFFSDYIVKNEKDIFELKQKNKSLKGTKKPVKCIETGIVYESISAASQEQGIGFASIQRVCNNLQKTAGGFHFEYV